MTLKLLYLLHFSLRDGLGLKTGIGPALAGVPPEGPFRGLARRLSHAVEEGHLLSQAEGGQVGFIQERLLLAIFLLRPEGLSGFPPLVRVLRLLLHR